MSEHPTPAKTLAALTIVMLAAVSYLAWFRPYQLNWGATAAEVERAMPGDELNPDPSFRATRAITIVGSPEQIWPWLLQMGYGRAGFYGYDLLENAGSPAGLRSADEILPELQHFRVGDDVPISAIVSMTFHAIEPNRHLIWTGSEEAEPGVFTWALVPLEGGRTRLVSRIRWSYHRNLGTLPLELFTELADHIAVRKILQGVKDRVEGHAEPMWVQNVELFTFLATLCLFLAALLLLFLRRLVWQSWGAALLAGAVWLATWYAPLPTPFSVLLALAALAVLCLTSRHRRRRLRHGNRTSAHVDRPPSPSSQRILHRRGSRDWWKTAETTTSSERSV